MWGPDIPAVPAETAIRDFGVVVLAFIGFGFLVKYVLTPEVPVVRREYPFSGLTTALGGPDDSNMVRIRFIIRFGCFTYASDRQELRVRVTRSNFIWCICKYRKQFASCKISNAFMNTRVRVLLFDWNTLLYPGNCIYSRP